MAIKYKQLEERVRNLITTSGEIEESKLHKWQLQRFVEEHTHCFGEESPTLGINLAYIEDTVDEVELVCYNGEGPTHQHSKEEVFLEYVVYGQINSSRNLELYREP